MRAFQSFLQKSDEPKSIDLVHSVGNFSDTEEKTEGPNNNICTVCSKDLGDMKKFW